MFFSLWQGRKSSRIPAVEDNFFVLVYGKGEEEDKKIVNDHYTKQEKKLSENVFHRPLDDISSSCHLTLPIHEMTNGFILNIHKGFYTQNLLRSIKMEIPGITCQNEYHKNKIDLFRTIFKRAMHKYAYLIAFLSKRIILPSSLYLITQHFLNLSKHSSYLDMNTNKNLCKSIITFTDKYVGIFFYNMYFNNLCYMLTFFVYREENGKQFSSFK